jgi:hypothetical protein
MAREHPAPSRTSGSRIIGTVWNLFQTAICNGGTHLEAGLLADALVYQANAPQR